MLTGASGFIGSRIARALAHADHDVVCALRDPNRAAVLALPGRPVEADLARDLDAADWRPRLRGVDCVINAAGILQESGEQRFATLHVAGPCALFEACAQSGVRRVINISALGADAGARSEYHLSKKAADDFLLQLPVEAVVIQPGLVYGPDGRSARLFNLLASLPLIPVPGRGMQQVQPIHVDDAVEAIIQLSLSHDFAGERVPVVGPRAISLRQLLDDLRRGLRLGPGLFLPVPMSLMRLVTVVAGGRSRLMLDRETLAMLERGNAGSPDATRRILGRDPRPATEFVEVQEADGARVLAQMTWLLPVLRWSVAAVWIITAIVSLGLYPRSESYALLARVGVSAQWAPLMLYGAALFDLALGLGTLLLHCRALWLAQIALIVGYTAVITLWLPEFWLHPFGPIVKNVPLLALLGLLLTFERR